MHTIQTQADLQAESEAIKRAQGGRHTSRISSTVRSAYSTSSDERSLEARALRRSKYTLSRCVFSTWSYSHSCFLMSAPSRVPSQIHCLGREKYKGLAQFDRQLCSWKCLSTVTQSLDPSLSGEEWKQGPSTS